MIVQQCELVGIGPDNEDMYMVVWLDARKSIKRGNTVVGKDKKRWRIHRAYEVRMDTDHIHTDWEVGGLE